MTRIGLAVASIGMAAALTACGGGSGGDDDFTGQSGSKIADASKDAMEKLKAVKVEGAVKANGQEVALDIQTNNDGDCTGEIEVGGGKAELVGADGKVWFKPDAAFWKASAGESADQIVAIVGDKWVVVPSDGGGFDEFCDIDDLLDQLLTDGEDDDAKYTKGRTEEVDGEDAIAIEHTDDEGTSTGYVRVDSPHYLVKIEKTKGDDTGSVTFSEFDEKFTAEAPADDDVIDLDSLQG